MNDERDSSSQDPLDDWLAKARWPEPTAISIERLRGQWRRLGEPRRHPMRSALAVAAGIVVAIGCWMWFADRSSSSRSGPSVSLNPFDQVAAAAPAPPPRLSGREMTPLEQTLLAVQMKKESRAKSRDAASERSEGADSRSAKGRSGSSLRSDTGVAVVQNVHAQPAPTFALRPFLERVANANTRAEALAELDQIKPPPIDQLLSFLNDSRADLRVASALALGRIDGPVLTRRLINMVADDQHRREAFIALAASRGEAAQEFVRQASASQSLSGLARSTLSMNELQ